MFLGLFIFLFEKQSHRNNFSKELESSIACTQEAKLCPDGSSVGRTEPNCEFVYCPQRNQQNTKERFLVYVQSVTQEGFSARVEVKRIEMLRGENAIESAIKDTGCSREDIISCAGSLNNGFYIHTLTNTVEKFTVNLSTQVYLLSETNTSDFEKISLLDLKKRYDAHELNNFRTIPFWITVDNGIITTVEEQYIP